MNSLVKSCLYLPMNLPAEKGEIPSPQSRERWLLEWKMLIHSQQWFDLESKFLIFLCSYSQRHRAQMNPKGLRS